MVNGGSYSEPHNARPHRTRRLLTFSDSDARGIFVSGAAFPGGAAAPGFHIGECAKKDVNVQNDDSVEIVTSNYIDNSHVMSG